MTASKSIVGALCTLSIFLTAKASADTGLATAIQPDRIFINADEQLAQRFGPSWTAMGQDNVSRAIVELANSLPVGGAIDLPRSVPCGILDFRHVADNVQVTGGHDGVIIFGGGQRGIELMFSSLTEEINPGEARPLDKMDLNLPDRQFAAADFKDVGIFGAETSPASDLFAMFNEGGIKIKSDVKHCAWICGTNSFGTHTVTADARLDDSLILWFGINWPFQDYNQHWNPKNAGRDWTTTNAQLHMNMHGGGQGTRLYEMIETSYGNPGPTAVFEDCTGLAIYHGSTERGSGQGPGMYWLHNCKNVQLGLRGINAFGSNNGDPGNADAARDITIEGGSGNILYAVRLWSNANETTLWNNDPALQLWMVAAQFEMTGIDNAFRFAVTPNNGKPTEDYFRTHDPKAMAEAISKLRERRIKQGGRFQDFVNPDSMEKLIAQVKSGRHLDDVPLNATAEQTFMAGHADLIQAEKPAMKIPAPPVVPATDAPRTRRPIAFTQTHDFGKDLLARGADPTGQKPSDDAFSHLLYGMSRDQLQTLIEEAEKLQTQYIRLRDERDGKAAALGKDDDAGHKKLDSDFEPKLKQIRTAIGQNWRKIGQKFGRGSKKEATIERFEIPSGTFLLHRPLYLMANIGSVFGAGPDKTILKTDQPIQVVKMQEACGVANLGIEGGETGLALTGTNHDDEVSPVFHSYVAGRNFYNITFRNQTFAGMRIGNDTEGLMGGSEHDQNKYVDLKFINTGNYGIYFNVGMLDKWLCLHNEFVGQKKAGISCQFNNLVHGCIVDSSFADIDGPAVNFFGGNVEIGYRPWEIWIDGCTFTECGNAQSFAVEQGISELSAFTHNTITTKQKKIAGGYAGSPQICQDNTIDVSLADGAPALKLRGVRTISVTRANGHVFRNLKANGPVVFVNDADQNGDLFAKTTQWLLAHRKNVIQKWDTNPMAHELAPANGWTHPFIFYQCDFGPEHYAYELLNADVDKGQIKQRIDLSKRSLRSYLKLEESE